MKQVHLDFLGHVGYLTMKSLYFMFSYLCHPRACNSAEIIDVLAGCQYVFF